MSLAILPLLVESSIRSVIVAALMATILLILRIRTSSVRHAAWAAVLGAMLVMPVLPYWVPAINVPMGTSERSLDEAPALPTAVARAFERADFADVSRTGRPPQRSPQLPSTPELPIGRRSKPFWPTALAIVYAAGGMALCIRLWRGWQGASRLVRASQLISVPDSRESRAANRQILFRESPLVAAPLTVGLRAPVIILPLEWRQWPQATLRAVVAHERAHVRRWDTLTTFLARINCAVFWFHPLAWWLERKLAVTAEQACDESAVDQLGDPRGYAEVLLDMAKAVRTRGKRLAWHGVGIDGGGLLAERIERILRYEVARGVSLTRKVVLASSALGVIFSVAACHRSVAPSKAARQQARDEGALVGDPYRRAFSSRRLGEDYAKVLAGNWVPTGSNELHAVVAPEPPGPRADAARRALAESNDDVLLTSAAHYFMRSPRGGWIRFDPDSLAQSCLERALRLNPRSIPAHMALVEIKGAQRTSRMYELILRKVPLVSQHAAVSALSAPERFELLPELALAAYGQAAGAARNDDENLAAYVGQALENSRSYAEDLLALAPSFRTDPRYGDAIYKANVALGSLALRDGKTKVAVEHLQRASEAPATEEWAYTQGLDARDLLRDLLAAGEREAVIDFLEHRAETAIVLRDPLREAAAAIRRGETPRLDGWKVVGL